MLEFLEGRNLPNDLRGALLSSVLGADALGSGAPPAKAVADLVSGVALPGPAHPALLTAPSRTDSLTIAVVPAAHTAPTPGPADLAFQTGFAGLPPLPLEDSGAPTQTTLYADHDTTSVGQPVTFTVVVNSNTPGPPTGTVTFLLDGTTTLGTATLTPNGSLSAQTTFTTSAIPVGTHTVTANYGGDTLFAASSGSRSHIVGSAATTTTLSANPNPSAYGQSVTLTAAVASVYGGTPTGTVTFKDGATTLGTALVDQTGTAQFSTTAALSAGAHSLTAVYGGDTSYLASTSAALTQNVQSASTSLSLTTSAEPSSPGGAVTFTAEVDGDFGGAPTGTVTFMDGTTTLGTGTLTAGGQGSLATFTTSTLLPGDHPITAVYAGDANFSGNSSDPLVQAVTQTPPPPVRLQYVWTGAVSDAWNVGANWKVNGVPALVAPGQNDDVLFSATAGSSANSATLSSLGTVSIHSLTLDASYTGTLTLNGPLEAVGGGMDIEGGAIAQPNGQNSDISEFGGAFTWGGGNINIGTAQSNLQLFNVTGKIDGIATNLGDNLDVNFGTTVTLLMSGGTLAFNLTAGINIASGGTLKWDAANGAITGAGAQIVNNGGTFLVTAAGAGTCQLPYYSNAASALLDLQGGSLEFTKAGANGSVYSVLQDNGTIYLQQGAALVVDSGLRMNGGVLKADGTAGDLLQGGDVYIHGGTVLPGGVNAVAGLGGLHCTGAVTMDGGTLSVAVNFGNGSADLWSAKSFDIKGTAALAVNSMNVPANLPHAMLFKILDTPAQNSITGDFANSQNILITGTNTKWKAITDTNHEDYFLSTP